MNTKIKSQKIMISFGPSLPYDVVVIGAGPAGISAAMMADQRGLNVLVIEEAVICSNLYNVPLIEDCPFLSKNRISGEEAALFFAQRFQETEIPVLYEKVLKIDHVEQSLKQVITAEKTIYSKAIIIASGHSNQKVTIRNSQKYYGRGVSYCAPCDVAYYLGESVAVVGRGENLAKAALYLAPQVKQVVVLSRDTSIPCSAKMLKSMYAEPKISVYLGHDIDQLVGKDKLEVIRVYGAEKVSEIPASALFIYDGVEGSSDFAGHSVPLTSDGFIRASENMETSVSGVFAIGGVRDVAYRRMVTAVADALMAVGAAETYLYFHK